MIVVLQLQQELQVKQNEIQREARKKEKLERDISSQKKDLDGRINEIKNYQTQLQKGKDDQLRLEQQLKEQRVRLIFYFYSFIYELFRFNTKKQLEIWMS